MNLHSHSHSHSHTMKYRIANTGCWIIDFVNQNDAFHCSDTYIKPQISFDSYIHRSHLKIISCPFLYLVLIKDLIMLRVLFSFYSFLLFFFFILFFYYSFFKKGGKRKIWWQPKDKRNDVVPLHCQSNIIVKSRQDINNGVKFILITSL